MQIRETKLFHSKADSLYNVKVTSKCVYAMETSKQATLMRFTMTGQVLLRSDEADGHGH